MKITIEGYKPEDIPAMLAIWNEVVLAGQAFPQDVPETAASAKTFFAKQTLCSVAKDEQGEILGLYILHPNNVGRCSHICNASYATAKTSRKQGIGGMLVEDSLERAKELGFRIMQFNAVTSDNRAANSLYQKLGFISLGSIPGGFRRADGSFQDINLYYKAL